MVVDDEPDVEALFRQQFRREVREGLYTLDFALSGKAALDKLDGCVGQQIILLVSDINMPGMSGLDLLPIVKARRPDLTRTCTNKPRNSRAAGGTVAHLGGPDCACERGDSGMPAVTEDDSGGSWNALVDA